MNMKGALKFVASRIDLINFYEVNAEDYQKLFGDEGDWKVID